MIEQDNYGMSAEQIATEKENVEKVLESIPIQDRVNIILQSFMVGAGSMAAHDMYVYYLTKQFSLTPREAGSLLIKCFTSLPEENKRVVIQAAYHTHLTEMKKSTKREKNNSKRFNDMFIGNFAAASNAIEGQLPTILGNQAFDDVTPEERAIIDPLPHDFTPDLNAPVVVALRKISDALGYYDDKEWKKKEVQDYQSS